MNTFHQVILFVSIFCLMNGDNSHEQEEEDINYYLGRLYEESGEVAFGPHDMLNYPGQKSQMGLRTSMLDVNFKTNDQEICGFDKLKFDEEIKKLTSCREQLKILEHDLEIDKQKLRTLERRILNEGAVDMKAFYRRLVHHLWNVLELKDHQDMLKETDATLMKHLTVRISKEDLNTLQNFLEHQNNVQQVDEFLQGALQLDDLMDDAHDLTIHYLMEWALSIVDVGKTVEAWLYVLCFGFILLGIWAIYLFIKDIQQELRWIRVIMMMSILMFFICCLWHWRHMHKVAESHRHAQMMKRGFNNIPVECKPGAQGTTGSVWEWIKVRAFGAPDVCEKYFEEFMIDPSEEITPAMVIAETLAKFFLQPLQHLGTESAKFITNFYQNVPVVYHIPATIFFVILLIIVLFAFCGYGIDFPLWMGGIRPIYRTDTADTSGVDRITKEAIAQLKTDREKFMTESRMMLTDIAQAAASSQVQAGVQPLLMMSSSIIESHLERLIARQFSSVIPPPLESDSSLHRLHSRRQELSPQNHEGVFTVTSTRLRRQHDFKSSSSNEDVKDGTERSIGNKNEDTANGAGALMVQTDAVHYRLKGCPRKGELPPKDIRGSSFSSASSNTDDCAQRNREYILESPCGDSLPEKNTNTSIIRKAVGQTNDSLAPSVNQSLNEISMEAFTSDESVSGENFYIKVKSILEDSANSSHNASHIERTEKDEEVELSASGVKFLNKIERVMTP